MANIRINLDKLPQHLCYRAKLHPSPRIHPTDFQRQALLVLLLSPTNMFPIRGNYMYFYRRHQHKFFHAQPYRMPASNIPCLQTFIPFAISVALRCCALPSHSSKQMRGKEKKKYKIKNESYRHRLGLVKCLLRSSQGNKL